MHERTVVPQSNLIQACEWILWGWEPVIKAEEPYCGQRKRPANCEENLDYHRAGNTLFDAFRQRFLKLYEKDDDEGKYYQELYKNKKSEEKGKIAFYLKNQLLFTKKLYTIKKKKYTYFSGS